MRSSNSCWRVVTHNSFHYFQVEVCARIEVVAVVDSSKAESRNLSSGETPYRGEQHDRKKGYEVQFKTSVNYVRDDNIVAEGTHSVWIPDYLHM